MRILARATTWALPAIALAIVLVAGTYKLSEAPAIWFDEGLYSQAAMNLAEHGVEGLQTAPGTIISNAYLTVGFPLLFPVSVSYKLFGVGVWQGRVVMFMFILAFVVASYVLVRMLFGPWYAAWTSLLVASFPILYGNGKPVLGEVPGMLFLVLTCIALLKLEQSNFKSRRAYVMAGFLAGLCVATKPIFILLVPTLLVTLFIRRRTTPLEWSGFLLAIGAFLLPILLWAYFQFGGEGTIAKQLEYYIASLYPTTDKIGRAVTNFLQFFTQTTPLYVAGSVVLWSLAIYVRKKRGSVVSAVELSMLVFCFFILLYYLNIQGWYRYFFAAQMVALLFLPYSLTTIFSSMRERFAWFAKLSWAPYAVLGLLIAGQLYQLGASSYVAGYYHSTNTADVRAALRSLGPKSSIFLVNVPEVAILLPSRNYYQYLDAAPDLRIGADQAAVLAAGGTDYAIVNADIYTKEPTPFVHYIPDFGIGRYEVLKRMTHK